MLRYMEPTISLVFLPFREQPIVTIVDGVSGLFF